MRSEVGEAELNYGYPRFPISTRIFEKMLKTAKKFDDFFVKY